MNTDPPITAAPVAPPRLDARYAITRAIGKGAMAKVYLAWDTKLRLWRAVKVLATAYLHDESARARFDGEAKMMARLTHRNLMPVVDVDTDGAVPYLVMDLARGGSIIDWMKRNGAVPPHLAVRIAIDCCAGLGFAHAQGVVHRDVKPHNILIHEDGRAIVTDFGIARAEDAAQLTANGAAMGTFAFMPPEQRADAHSVTVLADVYAMGATLFTMLTARTSTELFLADTKDNMLDGVPEVLRPIILQACRYEPELRYAAISELKAALEVAADSITVDQKAPALFQERIALAESMPVWVDPEGLEDLLRVLTPVDELSTTLYDPSARAAAGGRPPSGRSNPGTAPIARGRTGASQPGRSSPGRTPTGTTTPGSSGRSNPGAEPVRSADLVAAIPYQMPDRRQTPARTADAPPPDWLEVTAPSGEGAAPAPEPSAPRPPPTPQPRPAVARHEPAPRVPVPPATSQLAAGLRGLVLLVVAASAAFVVTVTVLLGASIHTKSQASGERQVARQALVKEVEKVPEIVEMLGHEGADVASLREAWFRFQDAPPADRADEAVAFAELAVSAADQLGPRGRGDPGVVELRQRLLDSKEADEQWTSARGSLLGRITGSLGTR